MGAIDGNEFVVSRGEGARVWDSAGREYLDASAGLWFVSVGHGRAEIADAAAAQMKKLAAHHCFFDHANEPAIELADRIVEMSPFSDGAVFFASGGSEAVDTASKLARRYWGAAGKDQKTIIIGREHAYHGMNAYGTELGGIPANRAGYGGRSSRPSSTSAGTTRRPSSGCSTARRSASPRSSASRWSVPAACSRPPEGYWPEIRAHLPRARHPAHRGRGDHAASAGWADVRLERYGMQPDLITFAKGVTSGYFPLGGVLIGPSGSGLLLGRPRGAPPFRHGYTYSAATRRAARRASRTSTSSSARR